MKALASRAGQRMRWPAARSAAADGLQPAEGSQLTPIPLDGAVSSLCFGDLGESWGAVRFSVCLHLIDDDVENVAPPQIAPSPSQAKDLRF